MSDYTKTTNFTAKDNLSTGNALKVIKGAYFDTEFDAIATASATKYDSGNLSSQAEAEALSSDSVLITPHSLNDAMVYRAAILKDLQLLTVAGFSSADALIGWDTSAGAAIGFTLGAGILHSGTALSIDHDAATNFVAGEHILHSGVDIIAGAGMTGGGDITADRTLNVIGGDGITVNADDIIVDLANAYTWSAAHVFNGNATFNEQVSVADEFLMTGVVDLALSGTEDDYALGTNSIIRITTAASTPKLGGIAGGADGRIIYVYNTSGSSFTIENEDSGSTAANRITTTGVGRAIADDQGMMMWYDGTTSRWRLMGL